MEEGSNKNTLNLLRTLITYGLYLEPSHLPNFAILCRLVSAKLFKFYLMYIYLKLFTKIYHLFQTSQVLRRLVSAKKYRPTATHFINFLQFLRIPIYIFTERNRQKLLFCLKVIKTKFTNLFFRVRVIPWEKSRPVSSKVKWNERVERGADRRGAKQATSAGDLQKIKLTAKVEIT